MMITHGLNNYKCSIERIHPRLDQDIGEAQQEAAESGHSVRIVLWRQTMTESQSLK